MNSQHPVGQSPDCETIQELIPDYAFGLAAPDDIRLIEANLGECREAAGQLADYQRLQADLRVGVPQLALPDGSLERLMSAINEPQSVSGKAVLKQRQRLPVSWLIAVAA